MPGFFNRIKEMIYGPEKKPLTPEQTQAIANGVKEALISMRSHCSWAKIEVNAAIDMARAFREDEAQRNHYRRMLKLRLVIQQYMQQMCLAMETISSQIELAQLSTEMGAALKGATQLVNGYQQDMPSFATFVRDFMKVIAPMNEALNGGLNEMTAALDELSQYTLDGIYSEEDLDKMILGNADTIKPVKAAKPARPVAGCQIPTDARS